MLASKVAMSIGTRFSHQAARRPHRKQPDGGADQHQPQQDRREAKAVPRLAGCYGEPAAVGAMDADDERRGYADIGHAALAAATEADAGAARARRHKAV